MLVLAEDRTEARRLEAIRRDFVVNVSHELKTPVGALALLAETMQDAADDPDAVRRFAGRMQQESMRLSALVHEIIELSRLQVAGALQEVGLVGVDAVVAEAVDRARVARRRRTWCSPVGRGHRPEVYGDHALLVTAVRNLLDNAVAYSDGRHPRRRRGVRTTDGLVEIAVVDQGIGISAEEQEPRLRAVLPGRPRALPRHRRHRPRPEHRQARRGRPRRRRDDVVPARQGLDLHAADPRGARPGACRDADAQRCRRP